MHYIRQQFNAMVETFSNVVFSFRSQVNRQFEIFCKDILLSFFQCINFRYEKRKKMISAIVFYIGKTYIFMPLIYNTTMFLFFIKWALCREIFVLEKSDLIWKSPDTWYFCEYSDWFPFCAKNFL